MVDVMTIVVVDRWHAYYYVRCCCLIWYYNVADGEPLRQML